MDILPLFNFEQDNKSKGKTCLTCEHRQRWQCGGRIIQYCGATKSNRTFNGLKKIKAKDPACYFYKEESK